MLLKRNPGRREVDHCNDQGEDQDAQHHVNDDWDDDDIDIEGLTPLHLAVVHGEDSMLKQLLAYGAKPDLQVILSLKKGN